MQTAAEKNLFFESAKAYATVIGWSIFPVAPMGKNPLTTHGLKDATRNMEQIKEWSDKFPNANIAVPTGSVNGFFVLDVDIKRDKNGFIISNGHETLENLTDQYGELPESIQQISGSREGHHHLYKYHDGIKNDVDFLPGLDIRGDGGYIVAAPSIHESGNKYEWEVSSRPLEVDIAESPKWLLDIIQKPKQGNQYEAKPVSEYVQILQGVDNGERNNSLMTLIGHLLARNIHYAEAFEIVHMWNESRVNPPLSPDVVTTAFNNIMRKESEQGAIK